MKPRRGLLLAGGAALLVVLLVGGRWLALETAERAWTDSFAGGAAVTDARALARLLQLFVVFVTVSWATANLFAVYRTIGSVQLPRRMGDIEIVEAVPQRVLFAITIGAGVVGGLALALGTGDWWRTALIAAEAPQLGVTDPVLGRDAGYYLAVLPWQSALQARALWMTAGAVGAAALLYAAIGSLRMHERRLKASDHARAHLSLALTGLAAVLAWGAVLDPAEVVAGMHGDADGAMLAVRLPAAPFVASMAGVTALVSFAWGWRDRPTLLLGSWGALALTLAGAYLAGPAIARAAGWGAGDGAALAADRVGFERRAFGLDPLDSLAPPGVASAGAAMRAMPLWDAARVGLVTRVPGTHATPWSGRPRAWLVAPAGERGVPQFALETDTGLALAPVPDAHGDTLRRFGPPPGFDGFTLVTPDSWPALARWGIPLAGAWRRAALAWTLQAPELTRDAATNRALLWRRDPAERFARLAPFAEFETPAPVLLDDGLWWVSWGYLSAETFPLARALPWRGRRVRYLSPALVGAVRAATGETRLWLAPNHDAVALAWSGHFSPLIEPAAALPAALLGQLDYPAEVFRLAAAQLARERREGDSALRTLRPADPFELALVDGGRWTGVGMEEGAGRRFAGVLAGRVTAAGPRLTHWAPGRPARLPPPVVASAQTARGDLRIWAAGDDAFTVVARFTLDQVPRLLDVYVSLGERVGEGPTVAAAVRALGEPGGGRPGAGFVDTTLAGRWARARALAAAADSALARGDLERFGRLWSELARLLAPPSRPR